MPEMRVSPSRDSQPSCGEDFNAAGADKLGCAPCQGRSACICARAHEDRRLSAVSCVSLCYPSTSSTTVSPSPAPARATYRTLTWESKEPAALLVLSLLRRRSRANSERLAPLCEVLLPPPPPHAISSRSFFAPLPSHFVILRRTAHEVVRRA